jgi:type I restriction enzyme S subunit
MSNNNENKLVQTLRFPNYSENWTVLPVSEMCEVFRGSSLSKSDLEDYGTEPCIHYGELFTKYNEVISEVYSKTNKINGFRSEVGDVLMPSSDVTPTGLAKASAIMLDNVILGGDMNILRPEENINSIFLSYLLNRSKKEIIKLVSGTTVKHIYPSQIVTCRLPIIRNSAEQKRIASCLSSLDEVITAENQKLEVLKEHKKGLLQNLFPQEGETVPKVRFKEFEDSGEWEVKELNELGFLINGLTYSPEDVRNKGLLVLRSSNIQDGTIDLKDCVYVKEDIKGANLIETKDILVCVRNGSKNLIGKNAIIPDNIPFATHGAFMTVFRANKPDFVYQLFQTDYYDKQVKADLGATINSINGRNFIKYEFPIPENPKEQQKIASTLSSLDDLINAQNQKIEALKLHKKGLLQGLFPNLNE